MNAIDLERRLQRIERMLDDLASAGRPRIRTGSWTPEMFGSTTYGSTTYDSSLVGGRYLLIDNICWFLMLISWTSTTATGFMRFTLPFANSAWRTLVPLRHSVFSFNPEATLHGRIRPGDQHFVIFEDWYTGSSFELTVKPAGYIEAAGFYIVAT